MADRPAPQKSADAYRTISEVADELQVPQHVLRFWETRFAEVRPLKRAGGRRFYRPEDVALLRAVRTLLYGEGYTIKGVQRLLAEFGARHVADALARSREASPAGPASADGVADDRGDGEGSARAMAEDRGPGRREPPPEAPRPDPAKPRAAAASPGTGAALADRLADVLVDLAECGRLLASVRSTDN